MRGYPYNKDLELIGSIACIITSTRQRLYLYLTFTILDNASFTRSGTKV